MVEAKLLSDHVSVQALSQKGVEVVTETLRQQIEAEIASGNIGSFGFDLSMLIVQQSPILSAVNTNVFQVSEPNSIEPKLITAFYPLRTDSRYGKVSYSYATISMNQICLIEDRILFAEFHREFRVVRSSRESDLRSRYLCMGSRATKLYPHDGTVPGA